MNTETSIELVPLSVIFIFALGLIVISISAGYAMGNRARRKDQNLPDAPIVSVVGAMLGLLALMLAFTFGVVLTRFETRKKLLLDEVNAIGTTVLRADFLPEPQRAQSRSLLKQYVDARVRSARAENPEELKQAFIESDALQDRIWSLTAEAARTDLNSPLAVSYFQSLNEMIDLHTSRVTIAFHYRLPAAVWMSLLLVTAVSMGAVGYQFAGTTRKGVLIHLGLALSVAYAGVVVIVFDLDRPSQGMLRISQQPMLDLQQKMSGINP